MRELACPPAVTPVVMSKLPETEGGPFSILRFYQSSSFPENDWDDHDEMDMMGVTPVVKRLAKES